MAKAYLVGRRVAVLLHTKQLNLKILIILHTEPRRYLIMACSVQFPKMNTDRSRFYEVNRKPMDIHDSISYTECTALLLTSLVQIERD